jgi:outer membrane protein TolC
MSRLFIASVLSGVVVSSAGIAQRDDSGPVLDEQAVVTTLSEHSPVLRGALLSLETARATEEGLEAQYAATIVLDASATQTTTPSLFRGGLVSMNRVRRADTGAELRKHLVWGTDLTLRVAGNVQSSLIKGGFISTGSLSTLPTSTSTGLPVFKFGPGYGVLGKLTLKQPLLRGRGRDVGEADLRASSLDVDAKERARARIASESLRDALLAYWEVWVAQEVVHVNEEALRVAKAQRDDAEARVRTGSLAPADALAFETAVATREESLVGARSSLEAQRLTLTRALGLTQQGSAGVISVDAPRETFVFAKEVAEERALAESPDIREKDAAVELARLKAKTAADPERHRLDLESYAQLQGLGNESVDDSLSMFVRGKAVSAFVGLTYEAPVTSQRERAAAAKARLAVSSAEEDLRAARQRVLTEVRTALDAASAAEQRVALGVRTVDITGRQREAEVKRYASGSGTSLNVLKAEDDLHSAEQRLLRARADAAENALRVEHLTGRLIQRYAGEARLR